MKTIAYILILSTLLAILPTPTEAGTSAIAIEQARFDAERDLNKQLWFMTGCCLSGIGYTIVFLTESDIPVSRLMGKPPEYVFFYIQEYERKKNRLQAYYTTLGALTQLGGVVLFGLLRAATQ